MLLMMIWAPLYSMSRRFKREEDTRFAAQRHSFTVPSIQADNRCDEPPFHLNCLETLNVEPLNRLGVLCHDGQPAISLHALEQIAHLHIGVAIAAVFHFTALAKESVPKHRPLCLCSDATIISKIA